jgi:hypothetical protein
LSWHIKLAKRVNSDSVSISDSVISNIVESEVVKHTTRLFKCSCKEEVNELILGKFVILCFVVALE